MRESDPAGRADEEGDGKGEAGAGHRFRVTLVSVLLVQVIALLLLGWMQHHFSH